MKRLVFASLVAVCLMFLPVAGQASMAPLDIRFEIPNQFADITAGGGADINVSAVIVTPSSGGSISLKLTDVFLNYTIAADGTGTVLLYQKTENGTTDLLNGTLTNLTYYESGNFTIDAAVVNFTYPVPLTGVLTLFEVISPNPGEPMVGGNIILNSVATPIPPAALLLGAGLAGVGIVRKRIGRQ